MTSQAALSKSSHLSEAPCLLHMDIITPTSPGPLCEPGDIKSEKKLHKQTDLVKCRVQSLWPSEKVWGPNRWRCCTLKKTTVHLPFQEITHFHFLWCLNAWAPSESGSWVLWASAIEIQKPFPINHPPRPAPWSQAQPGASPPVPAPRVPVTPCPHTPLHPTARADGSCIYWGPCYPEKLKAVTAPVCCSPSMPGRSWSRGRSPCHV